MNRGDQRLRCWLPLIAGSAAVWTLLPALLTRSLPLDTLEAVLWGRNFTLGNYKHPPLSGWMAYWVSTLTGDADWSLFLLGQLMALTGFFFSWRLAREFLDAERAVISVLLLSFLPYYNLLAFKFNVNTVELALWPACAYFFFVAVRYGRMRDWCLLGAVAALNVLGKYSALLLLFACGVWLLGDKTARKRLASFGPYCALGVFLLGLAPHCVWLLEHDFLPFHYVSQRLEEGGPVWYQPLRSAVILAAPALALTVIALIASRGRLSRPRDERALECVRFNAVLTGVPALAMLIVSCCGGWLDTLWAYPMYFGCGMLLAALPPPDAVAETARKLTYAAVGFLLAVALGYVVYMLAITKERHSLSPATLRTFALRYAKDRPITAMAGNMWGAGIVHRALGSKLPLCVIEDPVEQANFDLPSGTLLVGENPDMLIDFAASKGVSPAEMDLKHESIRFRAPFGAEQIKYLCFGLVERKKR